MRISHPDYIKLVMEAYNKKRTNNGLSLFLVQSTPAKIRQACLHIYKERFDKKDQQLLRKDEQLLKDFFGPAEHGKHFLQVIRNFDADRFKPLVNYLKKNTEHTDDKNIELLAWLIDFEHRPFVYDKNVLLSEEELSFLDQATNNSNKKGKDPAAEVAGLQRSGKEPGNVFKKDSDEQLAEAYKEPPVLNYGVAKSNSSTKKYRRTLIMLLILVICTAGLYVVWKEKKVDTACGYWAGDHYEEVPCSEDPRGRIILTMNRDKMQRFREITRKDTITAWSIGKMYYIKDNNKIKYYTEPGNFPEDIKRPLKKLSAYIFEKDSINRKSP